VEFRILGPLEVVSEDGPLPLGGPNQRALLALLVLHANESVRRERLIDEIWGESPQKTAAVSLNGYVSKLRKLLTTGSGATVETRPEDYALRVEPEQLDANRFESLVAKAREARAEGRAREAEENLASALRLWRGPPLADLAYAPFAQSEISRLEEMHLAALEDRFDVLLDQGRHADVVGELEKLASDHLLRERPAAQLMPGSPTSPTRATSSERWPTAGASVPETTATPRTSTIRLSTAGSRPRPGSAAPRVTTPSALSTSSSCGVQPRTLPTRTRSRSSSSRSELDALSGIPTSSATTARSA
jgi:DNA-binding SARP family transcriptional activator